jgi:hypothetical protein
MMTTKEIIMYIYTMSPSEQAEYEYEYERWIDLQDPTSIVSINAECQVVAFEQQRELQEYND